ncbi:hypothetical protein F2Q70_00000591 [Brassica cretica]|uniref:Uncharacterized protein n=1 Tax=Brassica cretica TaxID=69181 RepID=A0A8S9J598_BRACR|nr:hypothetical protein F2Q70_00000591 [Brassica cretica]
MRLDCYCWFCNGKVQWGGLPDQKIDGVELNSFETWSLEHFSLEKEWCHCRHCYQCYEGPSLPILYGEWKSSLVGIHYPSRGCQWSIMSG